MADVFRRGYSKWFLDLCFPFPFGGSTSDSPDEIDLFVPVAGVDCVM